MTVLRFLAKRKKSSWRSQRAVWAEETVPPSGDVGERQERDVPFDDFVEGKGRGLIVLLQYALRFLLCPHELTRNSGSPGVGKTLTAEAISERLKRPFYSVCDMS
jgi:Cdc6-like AAA superfamily ATPase